MESATKNLELIDKFIENQRKARIWTIISVIIFVVMAVIVLIYSKQLAETKVKLTQSELELQKANEKLETQNRELDSLNNILAQRSDSVETINTGLALNLDKNKIEADSVRNLKDTLTVLLNTTLQQYINDNALATEKINELYQQAFPGSAKNPSWNITQQIIKTNVIKEDQDIVPVIAVRYMEQYKDIAFDLARRLESRDSKIEAPAQVKGGNFNPLVKYFSEADKKAAEKLAGKLNNLYKEKISQPFEAQQVDITMPARHFEIWIGKYKKKNYTTVWPQGVKRIN